LRIKTSICDWNGLPQLRDAVLQAIERGSRVCNPFVLLNVNCTSALQRKCAELFVKDKFPVQPSPMTCSVSASNDRIRVAYLSADFHSHATAYLMAGVFEQHRKDRFELYAISFGKGDGSEMRARLEQGFEHFIDVRQMSDKDVAALLRDKNVDIAVDLKGFTREARTGIFALRPAPIQVNYLGYPGTMGAGYFDYLIADRIVVPEVHQPHYSEKLVYLPDTYQCNDSKRAGAAASGRVDVGLPVQGFVFCSFNHNHKITPEVFDVWMRMLHQVKSSVLWLLRSHPSAAANLQREAESRGISGERLIFAPQVPQAEHLARLPLADLVLDTLPYGAHTTASDALWAGVPVLTCTGETFPGRVGTSLLNAIGLPELVTDSLAEYERRALSLARDPFALAQVRAKLVRNRDTHPLFDTARFTRHLEAAYTRMVERYRSGEPPAAFAVEALDA
jgi:predicted O-linked N-acetylglucosamine transferase (SPINDLY family)